jgi:hypothetical protein
MNIQGNVAIVGTISFGGSGTTVTTANLAVDAPIIFSGTGNVDDLLDLGQVGEYTVARANIVASVSNKALTANIATLTTNAAHGFSVGQVLTITGVGAPFDGTFTIASVPTTTTFTYAKEATNVSSAAVSPVGTATVIRDRRYAGIVRDASDGLVKFFTGASTKPSTTVNFSEAGLAYADVQTGAITATSGTFSTGVTSTVGTNALKDLTLSGTANTFGTSTIAGAFTVSGNPTFSGTPVFSGNPSFTGNPTFSGSPVFTGGIRVQEMVEDVADVSHSANVVTLDYSTGNIFWLTNTLSANATVNLTNVPTTDGRITTINFIVPQSGSGFIPGSLTINGAGATIRWAQGLTPAATSSSGKIDIFSFSIVRRASTFTVFASLNANY